MSRRAAKVWSNTNQASQYALSLNKECTLIWDLGGAEETSRAPSGKQHAKHLPACPSCMETGVQGLQVKAAHLTLFHVPPLLRALPLAGQPALPLFSMQPVQGQYYHASNQPAQQLPGMQQAPYGGPMPGQLYQQRPPLGGHLNSSLQQPSPPAPSGLPYALPGFSPVPGYTQQRGLSPAAGPAPGGGGGRPASTSSQSTQGKIMRAQHLGGGSPQVHAMLPMPAPPAPMYAAQTYQPGMVLVQQPQQVPHLQQQLRAPPHHYHVPLSRPPPPQHPPLAAHPPRSQQQRPPPQHQQQQHNHRQQARSPARSTQDAGQRQGGGEQQQGAAAAPQQGNQQGQRQAQQQAQQQGQQQGQQQQQQRQGGGTIMRPQQLSPGAAPAGPGQQAQQQQGQHTSRIMRPTTHAQPSMLPRPPMYHPPPPPGPMRLLHSPGQALLLQPVPMGSPARPMVPAMLPPTPAAGAPNQQHQQQAQQPQQHGRPRSAPLIVAGCGGGRGSLGGAGGGPRVLLQAPGRKQKKREVVLPVERLTENPVPRAPLNEEERKEVEEWIKERKKHFPSAAHVAKKEQEVKERAARGELDLLREERRRRLHDIIVRQQSMGLAKAAGTLDMYFAMSRGGGQGGGRGGRGRSREWGGRGEGGGGPRQFGYEAFMQAGNAPQHQLLPHHASGANTQPMHRQQQQQGERQGGGEGGEASAAEGPQLGAKRKLEGEGEGAAVEKRVRSEGEGAPASVAQAAGAALAPGGAGAALTPEQQQQPQGPTHHCQKQWEPRGGRGGRGQGRGRGGWDGFMEGRGRGGRDGFVDGRGRGRGRGRERGRGRVSWHDQQGHEGPPPQQQQQHQQQQWRPPRPTAPTLLQKLLGKEIRQDHSYLLQAFRFFVTNNFLLDPSAPLLFPQHHEEAQQAQQAPSLQELLANPVLAEDGLSEEEADEWLEPSAAAAAAPLQPAVLGGSAANGNAAAALPMEDVNGGSSDEEGEEEEGTGSSTEEEEEEEGDGAVEASPLAVAAEGYPGGMGEGEEGELLAAGGGLFGGELLEGQLAEAEGMEDVEFS